MPKIKTTANLLSKITKEANCSYIKACSILKDSKRYGIPAKAICKYRIWELTADQKKQLPGLIKTFKRNKEDNKKWLVHMLSERTGVSEEKMLKRYNAALKKGYNTKTFVFRGMYNKSSKKIASRTRSGNGVPEVLPDFKGMIIKKTGWSEGRYKFELLKTQCLSRCSEEDYFLNKMYEKSDKENADYLTEELKSRLWFRYSGSKEGVDIFRHKEEFAVVFKDYLGRKTFSTEELSYEEFLENIQGLTDIVFKPDHSSKGNGFIRLKVNESPEQNKEAFQVLQNNTKGMVEEFVLQHDDMASFYEDAVNTVRIITSVKDGEPHILCGVMRMAVDRHVDNWSQGGITVGIDLATGKLCTNGADIKGNIYDKHPVSGKQFKGFQIPSWDKITDICLKAALVVEDMRFIGWDVAVRQDGEVSILEGNHGPSVALMQQPFADSHIGLKPLILPYVDGVYWE